MRLVPDAASPEPLLAGFERYAHAHAGFFAPDGPAVTVARAPARIDLMGGIADYSGSVVFEAPLGRATVVGCQPADDGRLVARSATLEEAGEPCEAAFALADLTDPDGRFLPRDELRRILMADADSTWAAYALGVLPVLAESGVRACPRGARFLVWSDIPIGSGVSSSAALEVAAMGAALGASGAELAGPRLAALAQIVENEIVGAPCGIMDQVTSALGREGRCVALLCRPCTIEGQHALPDGVRVFGLGSRVTHSVGGSAYATARISAFMGLAIIAAERRRRGLAPSPADRYLCALSPEEYVRDWRPLLPETIGGRDFLAAHGPTPDPVTTVDPDVVYRVRAGADHPVFENARVRAFIGCMDRAAAGDRTALVEAGGLMAASHWSYSWNCALGCPETDLIVRLVAERGPAHGLYGAKITGGGSGGTVAILADTDARGAVLKVAAAYEAATGHSPDLFDATSPGACAFGTRTYRVRAR